MVNNASKEQRVGSAIFYGVVSCTLMLLNKQIFAVGFPSHKALALAQMFTTCVVLTVLRLLGKVQFPAPSIASVKAVFPLPLFFLLNLVAGLGGTASLSLPMFTSLRRFSIWFTLIAERYVFGTQHSFSIKMAVGTMVLGSLVAAMNDLAFDSAGYFYATVNNFATAGNGISTKLKLEAKNLGVAGVLFYNSLLSMLILATYVVLFDMENFNESRAFAGWSSPSFVLMFGELLYNVLSLSLSRSLIFARMFSHTHPRLSPPLPLSRSPTLSLSRSAPPPLPHAPQRRPPQWAFSSTSPPHCARCTTPLSPPPQLGASRTSSRPLSEWSPSATTSIPSLTLLVSTSPSRGRCITRMSSFCRRQRSCTSPTRRVATRKRGGVKRWSHRPDHDGHRVLALDRVRTIRSRRDLQE